MADGLGYYYNPLTTINNLLAPEKLKEKEKEAYNKLYKGRWKAFKNFINEYISGKSTLKSIVEDYEDYLAMFYRDDDEPRLSLKEYFDASRAPHGRGTMNDYQSIFNKMGVVVEQKDFMEVRAKARNYALAAQYEKIGNQIDLIEGTIAIKLLYAIK